MSQTSNDLVCHDKVKSWDENESPINLELIESRFNLRKDMPPTPLKFPIFLKL